MSTPHRLFVLGNSGSGKSTYAKAAVDRHGLAHLDLDTIVWEPGQIAVARAADAVRADLDAFIAAHDAWVIEGCYGELVEYAGHRGTLLVFLNPGREACLDHNRRRPWEPHKYASPEAQASMLAPLQAWVADYYVREAPPSYAHHRRVFDAHRGPKTEFTGTPELP